MFLIVLRNWNISRFIMRGREAASGVWPGVGEGGPSRNADEAASATDLTGGSRRPDPFLHRTLAAIFLPYPRPPECGGK